MLDKHIQPQPPYAWFSDDWGRFVSRHQQQRMPHAFMLEGAAGQGSEALALAMGQYLLCQQPRQFQSCRECKSCKLLDAGTHPDFHVIVPQEPSKYIKISQIRELSDAIANTAQQGGKKIFVISLAEQLNISAANALLKMLEEPPGDAHFILVSQQSSFIPATIRSRCAIERLKQPNHEEAVEWLQRLNVDEPETKLSMVQGMPLKVSEWVEDDRWRMLDELERRLVSTIEGRSGALVSAKEQLAAGPLWSIDQMLNIVSRALPAAFGVAPNTHPVVQVLSMIKPQQLLALYDKLLSFKKLLRGSANPNAQLLLDRSFLLFQDLKK